MYDVTIIGGGIDESTIFDDLADAMNYYNHLVKNEYCIDDHVTPTRWARRDKITISLSVWESDNGKTISYIHQWDALHPDDAY